MQRALDSAIGLPRSSTNASWMLGLLMPEEQRRNVTTPPVSLLQARPFHGRTDPFAVETGRPPKTHRLRPDPASRPRVTFPNTGPAERLRAAADVDVQAHALLDTCRYRNMMRPWPALPRRRTSSMQLARCTVARSWTR